MFMPTLLSRLHNVQGQLQAFGQHLPCQKSTRLPTTILVFRGLWRNPTIVTRKAGSLYPLLGRTTVL